MRTVMEDQGSEPPGFPPIRATRLVLRSANSSYRTLKPFDSRMLPTYLAHSRSCPGGLTVAIRTSDRVSSIGFNSGPSARSMNASCRRSPRGKISGCSLVE